MKVTAATTVFLPITQLGKNYFPDIQKISGKKITAVNVVTGMHPMTGSGKLDEKVLETPDEGISSSLCLTENGTDYFLQDANLLLFIPEVNKGINVPVGRTLSVMDCYVNVSDPELVGKTMVIVFWYDTKLYSQPRKGMARYESFDVEINKTMNRFADYSYFPDIRTLADKSFEGILLNFPPFSPNFERGINATEASYLYVSLVKGSYAVLDAVPLPLLYQTDNYERLDFQDIIFDFENSFISAAPGAPLKPTPYKTIVNFTVKYR